jgi:hypothetical protein
MTTPMTSYQLPDGRIVQVDATAAKDAAVIGFELKRGENERVIVDAVNIRLVSDLHVALANAIKMNCDMESRGEITRAEWSYNQTALWDEAYRKGVGAKVREILCPPLVTQ